MRKIDRNIDTHKKRKRPSYSTQIYTLIGILIVILIYSIIALSLNSIVFPTLDQVLISSFKLLGESSTYLNFGASFLRLFIGIFIGGAVSFTLGLLAGYYDPLNKIFRPIILIMKSFPTICLLLVLLVFTRFSAYVLLLFVITPIIYETVTDGSKRIHKKYKDELKLIGNSAYQKLTFIILPHTIPYFIVGLLQSLGLGLKVLIMAEVVSGSSSNKGIGNLINTAYLNSRYVEMFAYAFYSILIVLIIDLTLAHFKSRLEEQLSDYN